MGLSQERRKILEYYCDWKVVAQKAIAVYENLLGSR